MKHLKEEFDKLTFKEALVFTIACISLVAAFVLLFLGLFIPPEGEIHDSVLTAFGIVLLFVGTLLGVSMHYRNELAKFKDKALGMIQEAATSAVERGIKPQKADGYVAADDGTIRAPMSVDGTMLFNNKAEEGVPV